MKKYTALLSVPRSPGNITVYGNNGSILFDSTILEKPLHKSEGDPREVYPFNAYTASGQAEGGLVYANFGTDRDFKELKQLNISLQGKIVIARYGKNFRGDKVSMAEEAGAVGVILFSDPKDFSSNVNYPDSWFLPDTGVQRGNILKQKGDPLSPGYPSIDGMYRQKQSEVDFLHRIPCQPISQKDAIILLSYLDGDDVPNKSWIGNFNITYRITSKTPITVRITVDVPLVDKPVYNVIGTIFGKDEPDRLVIIGNHRDAWVYGGADPSSGTASMLETARVIGSSTNIGWRPKRTLLVCSWGAEEYGLMGSKEWVEENSEILRYRAVVYLNIDISVQGSYSLKVKSSPQLVDSFSDVTKQLKAPGTNSSLYEDWISKFPDPARQNAPKIQTLGAGSDFTPFYSVIGIPSIDFRYTYDENSMKLGSYPVYHSIHDNYHWMTSFIDPELNYNKLVTQIWAGYTLKLLDSLILPFNATRYTEELLLFIESFEASYSKLLAENGVSIEMLKSSAKELMEQAFGMERRIKLVDISNWQQRRIINDQLMELERAFISADGLKRRKYFKHVLYSPSSVNIYLGRSFPAVIEAIQRVSSGLDKNWNDVNVQLAVVANHILMASKLLSEIGK